MVRTELDLATPPLQLVFEDFIPPRGTSLIRHVVVHNTGEAQFHGAFFHYYDLRLREVSGKQAVRWDEEHGFMLQYFRDTVIALGGTRPDLWRCGKSLDPGGPGSAKSDLYDGHLNGQPEDIGQVDFAVGYHLDLPPGESRELDLFLCAEVNPQRTSVHMQELVERGYSGLREDTVESDAKWLGRGKRKTSGPLDAEYQRAPAGPAPARRRAHRRHHRRARVRPRLRALRRLRLLLAPRRLLGRRLLGRRRLPPLHPSAG